MYFRRRSCVVALFALWVGAGCGIADTTAARRGAWTGTVRSLTVRDVKGQEWQAAALEIDGGPPLPVEGGTELYPPERALLLMTRRRPLRILDPAQLGVASGTRVRVRGTMSEGGVMAPPSAKRHDGGEAYGVRPVDRRRTVAIVLRGEPEVLDED